MVKFFNTVYLFQGLTDEQIAQIAGRCQSMEISKGEVLFEENSEPDGVYFIYSGAIHLTRGSGEKKYEIGTLIRGDFFGEEAHLRDTGRIAKAECVKDAVLIRMRPSAFQWMVRTYPKIQEELERLIHSYEISRKQNFSWIRNDETVHMISRKHSFLFYSKLVLPGLGVILSMIIGGLGLLGVVGNSLLLLILALAILFLSLVGALWYYIDWENDYYIITDQRVVWLEKIVALYDSRQETPLNAVLSVNVRTDQLQRIIGSGDVVVRTFTGSIVMRSVSDPDSFVEILNAFWARSKEISVQEEMETFEESLHQRLHGLETDEEETPKLHVEKKKSGFVEWLFGNAFKTRFVENNVITYRKHWILLIEKSWLSILALIAMFFVLVFGYGPLRAAGLGPAGILLWVIIYAGVFSWWFYHYMDWRNDIYQLTSDTILDIEKKPLGREEKKTAPLASVLSLTHTREGFIGLLFNFGNVKINVGSSDLTFYGVFNPAEVQHDIFDRMFSLRKKKENIEAEKERERMVEWLSIYHDEEKELREEQEQQDPDYY